jgi:hypothetical protein
LGDDGVAPTSTDNYRIDRSGTTMATERQIESNRQNALKSSGPKTDAGKARSRGNAIKHGMAAEADFVEDRQARAFEERREAWAADFRPRGEGSGWALDCVVAATFRIDACDLAFDGLVAAEAERARTAWDLDRRVDAETLALRLSKCPPLVRRQLEATLHGSELMIGIWRRLVEALDAEGEWSDAESSTVLDLLGLPADLRSGRTPLTPPEGTDTLEHLRKLTLREIDRLESLVATVHTPLDDLHRRQAEAGRVSLFSKPAQLVLRYERDAWRRYHASMRDLRNPPPACEAGPLPPSVIAPAAMPAPASSPRPIAGPATAVAPARPVKLCENSEDVRADLARTEPRRTTPVEARTPLAGFSKSRVSDGPGYAFIDIYATTRDRPDRPAPALSRV